MCFYNLEREKEFSWFVKCQNHHTKARCKLCSASFTIAYNGIKALTQHAKSQKYLRNVNASTASQRMSSFLVMKDSVLSENVTVAELTQIYHGVKHHIPFVAQYCAVNVMK